MNELVNEWINKAEADFRAARREYKVRNKPNWDADCFHCQQSVEKLLKAILQQNNIEFKKVHDLTVLLKLLLTLYPGFQNLNNDFAFLTVLAVEFRYPGKRTLKQEAVEAISILNHPGKILLKKIIT